MAFINRFSTTKNGAVVITGNTLGLSKLTQQNAPGILDSIGGFITTNTALPVPPAWASIVNLANNENITLNWQNNSSSAFLNIPVGATVLYAELIWSGLGADANVDVTPSINNPILFTTPVGGPTSISPDPSTAYTIVASGNQTWYTRSQNVTSLVTAGGSGKYTAGAVPSALDPLQDTSNFAGWSLIVAYQDLSLPIRNMTIFAGGAIVNTNSTVDTTVSGFITPGSGPINARILVSAGEGDATRTGDYMEFGQNTSSLTKLFGPNNPANPPNSLDNFFGSQINIGDPNNPNVGQLNTTGSFGSKNSNALTATNIIAGRQGWDVTNVDGSDVLVNGQTTAAIRFSTASDQYLPNALGIQIDTLSADISVVKTSSPNPVLPGQTLTYTMVVSNAGPDTAQNVTLTDAIPATILSPQFSTDGGATFNPWVSPYTIGTLANGASQTILIKGTVTATATGIITNTATVSSTTPDQNQSNNTSTVTTQVTSADVSIIKTSSPTTLNAGQNITYNIQVLNSGPSTAQNVILTDVVPAQILNPQFSIDGGATFNPWVSPYTIGTLANGASQTILILGKVASSATGSITNTATVSSTTPDPNPNNNTSQVTTAITTSADIALVKIASPSPVVAGGLLTYDIVVTNGGPSDAQNVVLTDAVPATVLSPQFSTDGGVTFNPWISPYTIGTLVSGDSQTIIIRGTVASSATGSITNTATVNSTTPDPHSGDNTSTVTTPITTLADVSVFKTANPSPVIAGNTLTYSVVVSNAGLSDAQNVVLTDAVPATILSPQFSTDGGATFNPWVSPYTIGTLASGASQTILIKGTVASSATGNITNTVTVSSTTPDPNLNNNTSTITTPINTSADISVVKTGSSNPILAGNVLTYTLLVSNAGPSDAQVVLLNDAVPAQILNPQFSIDSGVTFNPWMSPYTIGTLASGASTTILIKGTVSASATGIITNTATVTSSTPDPNPNNNTSTLITGIDTLADISVVKTGSPSPVISGQPITYTLLVSNAGPNDAQDVTLTDVVPAAVLNPQFSIDGGITFNPWVSPYTIGLLANGASQTIIIEGTVDVSATGSITNTATVSSSTPDKNPNNNTSTVITPINQSADISVVKTGSPTSVIAGEVLTYNIVVSNAGPNTAQNVTLTDAVPAQILSPQFSTDGGGTFNPWVSPYTIGTLTSGATQTIIIKGTVSPAATGSITNIATVSSTTPDPNLNNNTSTVTTPVTKSSDLSIVKTQSPNPVMPGQLVTYTIVVKNTGPSNAQNVTVTDIVSSEIPNPQFSVNGGPFNPWVSPYTIGTLANGASVTIEIQGTLSSSATGVIANTAVVNSSTPDPDISNNTSTVIVQINSSADVSVLKIYNPQNPNPGQNINYTIVVLNSGPADAQNVTLTDVVPPEIQNPQFSTDGGATFNPWISPYTIGTLANNSSVSIQITGKIVSSALGTLTNTAKVASTTPDSNPGNNTSTVATLLSASANVSVIKTGTPSPVLAGNLLTYNIIVSNAGPSDAQNITLTDAIPPTVLNPEFSTDGGITFSPWFTPYTVGTLVSGTFVNIKIKGTVASSATGSETNTAIVASSTPDPDTTNNNSTATTPINVSADISVVKTASPTKAIAGDILTYNIVVSNAGPSDAQNVILSDVVPGQILNPEFSTDLGITFNPWVSPYTIGTVTNNSSLTIQIRGIVDPSYTGIITNTATVNTTTPDTNIGNNTSTVATLTNTSANLSITKTATPTKAIAGNLLTYNIVVKNLGPSDAQNVTLNDVVPTTILNPQFSTDGGMTFNPWINPYAIGILANNDSLSIQIRGTVAPSATGNITNNASINSSTPDPDISNNTSTIQTPINTSADVSVIKIASPNPAIAGDLITYDIVVKNAGPSDAQNVTLTDVVPTTILNPEFSTDGGVIFNPWVSPYTIGTVTNGSSLSIQIRGTINSSATGSISNSATVASTTSDPNPNNNTSTIVAPLNTSADISVVKTTSTNQLVAGDQITYDIVVSNSGPSDAQNVTLTDSVSDTVLSPQFSTDGGVTFKPWLTPYTIGILASKTSVSIQIRGTINPSAIGNISNTATVASTTPDPNPNNNTSTIVSQINTLADLSIIKTGSPNPVIAGELLTYSIGVINIGPSDAQNVTLSDLVPPQIISPEFSTDGGMTFKPWINPYNIGTLAYNSSISIEIRGTVDSSVIGSISNTATVNSSTPDPNPNDNTSTIVIPVNASADISVVKTGNPNPIIAGNLVTYNIVVSNTGPSDAQNVTLSDVVSAQVLNPEFSTDGGVTFNPWVSPYTIGTLANGVSQTIIIKGTVDSSATGNITNTAIVSSTTPDPNPNNNTFKIQIPINTSADISVIKTGSPSTVIAGNLVTYNIVVSNAGPSNAQNVTLSDVVATQVLNPEFSTDGGITFNPWVSPYTIGTLANGASQTIIIKGAVDSSATGNITNTATVSSITPDPNPNNNTSTITTQINTSADISVIKTDSPSPAIAGNLVTYNIVVSNAGPSNAQNVTLSDVVAAQVLNPQFSTDGGETFNPWVSPYRVGTLANGASQTIIIKGIVASSATGTITNTATVNASTPDPNSNNNTSKITAQINNSADVSVLKTAKPTNLNIGDLVTYTIVVSNTGPSDSQNVSVADVVPAGVSNPQFSTDGGVTFNPWVSPYNISTLSNGASKTIIITGTISNTNLGLVNNTATISSQTPDPNPNNSTSTVTVNVVFADLISADNFVKTVDKQSAIVGDVITYTINVTNTGNTVANNVVINDPIPSGTSYVVGSLISNVAITGTPLTAINITNGIDPNETVTFSYKVTIEQIPSQNPIPNTALINYTYTVDPTNPNGATGSGNTNTVTTQVINPQLTLTKSKDKQFAVVGEIVTYSIIAKNTGDTILGNVAQAPIIVFDMLDSGLSFVQKSVTINGTPQPQSGILNGINIGKLLPGQSKVITFQAKVITPQATLISNTANASFGFQLPQGTVQIGSAISNTVILTTEVANIEVIKTANQSCAVLNDSITYTVSLNNTGTVDALNIIFEDELPTCVTLIDNTFTLNGVAINGVNLKQGINIGNLKVSQESVIQYTVELIDNSCACGIINNAMVSFSYILPDGSLGTFNSIPSSSSQSVIEIGSSIFTEIDFEDRIVIQPGIDKIISVTGDVEITNILTNNITKIINGELSYYQLAVYGVVNQVIEYIPLGTKNLVSSTKKSTPFKKLIALPENYCMCKNIQVKGSTNGISFNQLECKVVCTKTRVLLQVSACLC